MKALLIFLGALLGFLPEIYAQQYVNESIKQEIALSVVEDAERDKKSNTNNNDSEPSLMSLLPLQPSAYLYNNVVSVAFEGVSQVVEVRIVDNGTGETVYEESFACPGEVTVPLAERGDYTLQVIADGTVWEGWFVW